MTLKKIALASAIAVMLTAQSATAQRFMFTGVSDAEVLSFFGKLQGAVSSGNKNGVASMVNYPLRVNSRHGPRVVVATNAELVKQYDAVFTPAIRQAIITEKPSKLIGSREGVAIASGLVYLSGKCDRKVKPQKCVLGVSSVNHE